MGSDTTASPVTASARMVNCAVEVPGIRQVKRHRARGPSALSLTSVVDASAGTVKPGFATSAAVSVTVLADMSSPSVWVHS